jgi:hypothetical protein
MKYKNQAYVNSSSSGELIPVQWSGLMAGDGLSNDKLFCIHDKKCYETTVSQFLFRVEPARKIGSREQAGSDATGGGFQGDVDQSDKLREAETEEKEYQMRLKHSMGQPIYFGQPVILRHIFSEKYITLHINQLAHQIGAVKIGFSQELSEFSNLKFMPSSRIKKIGDLVSYSDAILIANAKEDHYYLHVAETLSYQEKGLEINASETKTEWKPKLFETDKHDQGFFRKSALICPGEVVSLFNKHISGYLSVSPKDFSSIASERNMLTVKGQAESLLLPIPIPFRYLEGAFMMKHNVCIEMGHAPSFYTMWEIQKVRTLDSDPITYFKENNLNESAVRIKNVATQFYLKSVSISKDEDGLELTNHGLQDDCIFYFTSKTALSENDFASSEDAIKIRNHHGRSIFPVRVRSQGKIEKGHPHKSTKDNLKFFDAGESGQHYEFRISERVDPNPGIFELVRKDPSVVKIGHQLHLIFNNLMNFHSYLQDWGMDENLRKEKNFKSETKGKEPSTTRYFSFVLAFESEKELESEIENLSETIPKIFEYLSQQNLFSSTTGQKSEQSSVRNKINDRNNSLTFSARKNLLIEQKILEILYYIADLIFFKSWESLKCLKSGNNLVPINKREGLGGSPQSDSNLLTMKQLKAYDPDKLENLPQLIARSKLEGVLEQILKIMHLAVWRNSECSHFLALKYSFFEKIIEFYPRQSLNILKEVGRNITSQEDEYIGFLEPWVKMLEELSEKADNIKKQTFLLNIFSELIEDEATGSVIEVFQSKVYQRLFQRGNRPNMTLIRFSAMPNEGTGDEQDNSIQLIVTHNTSKLPFLQ